MDTMNMEKSPTELLSEKILDVLNKGALGLMISIGHRTGLFDIMAELEPGSSEHIANKAELHERYVREWLGAMTVGGIIRYNENDNTYHLPREHSAILTRSAGADNFAVYTQYISLLGSVEDRIVHCFKNGGGVGYSEFPRFHEVMAEDSGQTVLPVLLDQILPLIPGIKEKLVVGINVLDLGCGRGKSLHILAEHFPNSKFTGYDLSEEAVEYASLTAREKNLHNISFKVKDLTNFRPEDKYDFITTFDAIHDQARPDLVLGSIFRTLKDDGVYLMQDISGSAHVHNNIDHPVGTFLYTVSTMHCMTVSLAQGGMGLGTFWGRETANKMLREAGFRNIEIKNLPHDIQNDYYVVRKR
jgi:2-polyprenyl-3-methyl-5-hydroxy-6-metoxy-1,4-benzoquinol methylase